MSDDDHPDANALLLPECPEQTVAEALAESALAGDSRSIAVVLLHFIDQGHSSFPDEVKIRLQEAVSKYISGRARSLDDALGLDTSDTARAKRRQDANEMTIHFSVLACCRNGQTKGQAIRFVAQERGLSVAQVRRYLKSAEDAVRAYFPEDADAMLKY